MANHKFRWSKVYESSEEELVEFLRSRGLHGERITSDSSGIETEHFSDVAFTLWCAEGSLRVCQDSVITSLQPGDAKPLDGSTPYYLVGGLTGYVCYITN